MASTFLDSKASALVDGLKEYCVNKVLPIFLPTQGHWGDVSEIFVSEDTKYHLLRDVALPDLRVSRLVLALRVILTAVVLSQDWDEGLHIQLLLVFEGLSDEARLAVLDSNRLPE